MHACYRAFKSQFSAVNRNLRCNSLVLFSELKMTYVGFRWWPLVVKGMNYLTPENDYIFFTEHPGEYFNSKLLKSHQSDSLKLSNSCYTIVKIIFSTLK